MLKDYLRLATRPGAFENIASSHAANQSEVRRLRKLVQDLEADATRIEQALGFFHGEAGEFAGLAAEVRRFAQWIDLNCELNKHSQTRRYILFMGVVEHVRLAGTARGSWTELRENPPWKALCLLLNAASAAHAVPPDKHPAITPGGIRMFLQRSGQISRQRRSAGV